MSISRLFARIGQWKIIQISGDGQFSVRVPSIFKFFSCKSWNWEPARDMKNALDFWRRELKGIRVRGQKTWYIRQILKILIYFLYNHIGFVNCCKITPILPLKIQIAKVCMNSLYRCCIPLILISTRSLESKQHFKYVGIF